MIDFDQPRLIADVGTTYAHFALETAKGRFEHVTTLRCAEFSDLQSAMSHYLNLVKPVQVVHAAAAVANPVVGDIVTMTNYHWQFSIEQTRVALGLETLVVVNDYTALAMAIPRLGPSDLKQIGTAAAPLSVDPVNPVEKKVSGIIGPGSGLGMSGLIPAGDGWLSLGSEGGHCSFAPHNELEIAVLRYAWKSYSHVSFERLLSGPGIELMYRALADHRQVQGLDLTAPEITERALSGSDPVCMAALDIFCDLLGTAAANLAVTLGATGGIYIGGGIVTRLADYFERSGFRSRFEEKGRFTKYLASIPTWLIVSEQTTFIGVSEILDTQLRSIQGKPGLAILGQIRRSRGALSPAEQRVADYVLEHPRTALNDPIGSIAKASGVSQPTVIRFCRSLGCEGLSDFKLRLASGLTGTIPLTHSQVTSDDSMLELSAKVLGNTASAILQLRNQINRDTIDRAIDLLNGADRVDFFAVGHYGAVAHDAQFKFLRLGIPSVAYTDPKLQILAAGVLKSNDVAVIINNSGKISELLEVAETARERGAAVISITAGQSPLSRVADVALIIDHVEDVAQSLPMISRILYLLLIDVIAVGVAMHRSTGRADLVAALADERLDESGKAVTDRSDNRNPDMADGGGSSVGTAAGIGVASPLSRLTSHSR